MEIKPQTQQGKTDMNTKDNKPETASASQNRIDGKQVTGYRDTGNAIAFQTASDAPEAPTIKVFIPDNEGGGTWESFAPNKAKHSPLPRLTESEAKENMTGAYITLADGRTQYCEHLSERERKAVNHADTLAEALRECRMALTLDYAGCTKRNKALCDVSAAASQAHNKAVLALAVYEADQ